MLMVIKRGDIFYADLRPVVGSEQGGIRPVIVLQSHISSMTDVLESDESIGRKLDFMAQEMNREANTILSKSSDVDLADHAIELKTNVEKVREQIQNIE